ncbi:hypothetical protein JWH04_16165 [Xanthomonas melonis]|uniref:hypothetical protein n=1 Tax=Xanthomonas melonis TaxID=56456 RepID=UPI001E57B3AE|nr:hypothetical protein [Xanthomonas melonis]MCD0280445.1 hypothetical protein [Xanthomonas melonis]
MIGTHNPKMFNARLKQPGVRARILAPEQDVVTSATTKLRRELWAIPTNSADMARERAQVETQAGAALLVPELPRIADPGVKQLLLPVGDWRQDEYVSTTPLVSMGLAHELYKRLQERDLPHVRWKIQPIPAALSNHGEALLLQSGAVRLLRRGVANVRGEGVWDEPVVVLQGRVERMSVAAGMLAVGWPAITAIGGLVHAIERKTGVELDFAFGMNDVRWIEGPLHTLSRGSSPTPPRALDGRIRAGQAYASVSPTPGYQRDEIQANGNFVLLLRAPIEAIAAVVVETGKITRLAGGSIFDSQVYTAKPGAARQEMAFLLDASIEVGRRENGADALDAALGAYGRDGEWRDGEWWQARNGYTLNASGYAWLEQPQQRDNVRGNYPHVWSESVFSLVTQGSLTPSSWWRRRADLGGVRWHGL